MTLYCGLCKAKKFAGLFSPSQRLETEDSQRCCMACRQRKNKKALRHQARVPKADRTFTEGFFPPRQVL